jgi:hypothetical protein
VYPQPSKQIDFQCFAFDLRISSSGKIKVTVIFKASRRDCWQDIERRHKLDWIVAFVFCYGDSGIKGDLAPFISWNITNQDKKRFT